MAEYYCGNCKKKTDVSLMRYNDTGSHLLCDVCRGKRSPDKPAKVKPLIDTPFSGSAVMKYQCPKCKYSFQRSQTNPPLKCPNCAGEKLLRFNKVSADDILSMTEDERFSGL